MEKGRRAEIFVVRGLDRARLGAPSWPPSSPIEVSNGSGSRERRERRARLLPAVPVHDASADRAAAIRRPTTGSSKSRRESGAWASRSLRRECSAISSSSSSARQPGAEIGVGDEIGSIEGLKAVTSVFSAGAGGFLGEGVLSGKMSRSPNRIPTERDGCIDFKVSRRRIPLTSMDTWPSSTRLSTECWRAAMRTAGILESLNRGGFKTVWSG